MSYKIGLGHLSQNTYAYNNPYARKYDNAYKEFMQAREELVKYKEECDDTKNPYYRELIKEFRVCGDELSKYTNIADNEEKQLKQMEKMQRQNQPENTINYFA